MRQLTLTGEAPEINVFTIGYGGRTIREIKAEMREHGITQLVDVRSNPYTERYGKEIFEQCLGKEYVSIPRLGGKNHAPGQFEAWKAVAEKDIEHLVELSKVKRIAVMCAEKDHIKCHRTYFIAKALRERGVEVQHL